jgi:hypothetical protein
MLEEKYDELLETKSPTRNSYMIFRIVYDINAIYYLSFEWKLIKYTQYV